MESSPNNQKLALRIAIIVATILALIIAAFLMFTSTNESKECVREIEQEREGYAKEQARFAEVLKEASDEELFIVLNYAIANHYGAIKCYKSSTNSLRKKQAKRETSNDIAV